MNKIVKIFEDAAKNAQGKYSNCRIGSIITLTWFLLISTIVACTKPELIFNHIFEIGAFVAFLLGGTKLAESYSEKIKNGAGNHPAPRSETNERKDDTT